jgi:ferrous iron transport protein B
MTTLASLRNGQEAEVKSIEAGHGLERRLERLGLRPGITVRKVSDNGPVVVALGGCQVALGRGMAARVSVAPKTFRVLLYGNPNVGKSVVFSRLTGLGVVTANYAGTTVEYTKGTLKAGERLAELIDVPGTYSLEATCKAEEVARDFCSRREADLIINVVDATNLERNLYLTLELLERGIPMVVALNKWDMARRKGIEINTGELAKRLGVPVVPVVAVTGQGLRDIVREVERSMDGGSAQPIRKPIDHQERWHIIGHISQEVQRISHKHLTLLERLEEASLRPLSGFLLAALVLVFTFGAVRFLGEGLINHLTDPFFRHVYGPAVRWLAGLIPWEPLRVLLLGRSPEFMESFGALTTGVYIPVALVLPYIFAFYLVLGVLEDVGYLPRLAVLLDRFMHRLGLHGYAAIPLVLGCGCKVPGVLALRVLESPRERFLGLALLLMAAPCLPQSAMMVSLLAPFGFQYVLLVFLALALVALANSVILNRMLKGEAPEIVMEIPSYQLPHPGTLWRKLWLRVRSFLLEATPLIVLGVLAVNVLDLAGLLGTLEAAVRPLVSGVLGLPQDSAPVIVFGFLRKDISIALLFPLHLGVKQAVTASLFLVLYLPCLATFFVAWREAGWRTALKVIGISFAWAALVGWLVKIIW